MGEGRTDEAELELEEEIPSQEGGWLNRLVWLVPLGLAVDIILSLWVSYRHVTHSVNIHTEAEWVAGERLAARAQLVDLDREGIEEARVTLSLTDAAGKRFELGELPSVAGGGLNQGAFDVPKEAGEGSGTAEFHFEARLKSGRKVEADERVPVALVDTRAPRTAVHRVASSMLQWADDTGAQPEKLRIDAMPYGRLLAGFDNQLLVRLTDPKGEPIARDLEVRLVSGEFGDDVGPGEGNFKGGEEAPLLYRGRTDPWGLVAFAGAMNSDVLRLQVEVFEDTPTLPEQKEAPADGAAPLEVVRKSVKRRFRLVSFSGGVRLNLDRQMAGHAEGQATVGLEGVALMEKRPIFVDVHGPDGAWIDTVMPPLRSFEPKRAWELPAEVAEGFTHFEAYTFTNAPGQSAEVARVWVHGREGQRGLDAGLIDAQRERLELPRDKTGFDKARESHYLDLIAAKAAQLDGESLVARWLMGSLPVEVYGPPVGISTRAREDENLAKWKASWKLGLRIFLWGGGGLAIFLVAVTLFREQSRLVAETQEVLEDEVAGAQMSARGDLFRRGIVVVVLLVSALGLTALMLESLIWNF
jgi:hypothetical protein